MSDDLISRKALMEALDNDGVIDGFTYSDGETLLQKIQSIQAADVALVKHGRNETQMNPVDEFICSECGFTVQDFEGYDNEEEVYYEFNPHYCPNCGAIMDGGDEK